MAQSRAGKLNCLKGTSGLFLMAHKLRMFLYFYTCKWNKKGKGGKEDEVEAEAAKMTT